MGSFRRWFFLVLMVILAIAAFLLIRTGRSATHGPPVANCPGPDGFGYLCEVGGELEYVDASEDTLLYADDAVVELALPFTFPFYGQEYNLIRASSNGNLQFSTEIGAFFNLCIWPDTVPIMGEMIAPYWDDLDLTFEGALETEEVGVSPNRVFVIEWDNVPYYGNSDQGVTFEAQLFESGEIAFLYESVLTDEDPRGSSATIGIQSGSQGIGLQFSCNQFSVIDNNVVRFYREGSEDEAILNRQPAGASLSVSRNPQVVPKGQLADLIDLLNRFGAEGLDRFRALVRSKGDAQDFQWRWADIDGDGSRELVVLWGGPRRDPISAQVAVIRRSEDRNWRAAFTAWPLARRIQTESMSVFEAIDVTGDKVDDVVLRSELGTLVVVLTTANDEYELSYLQEYCPGKLFIKSAGNREKRLLVRTGCKGESRAYRWNGNEFFLTG